MVKLVDLPTVKGKVPLLTIPELASRKYAKADKSALPATLEIISVMPVVFNKLVLGATLGDSNCACTFTVKFLSFNFLIAKESFKLTLKTTEPLSPLLINLKAGVFPALKITRLVPESKYPLVSTEVKSNMSLSKVALTITSSRAISVLF